VFNEYVQVEVPAAVEYTPSTANSTFESATLSDAAPDTVIVPPTVAPAAGDEMAMVGAVVSLGGGDVLFFPLPFAIAVGATSALTVMNAVMNQRIFRMLPSSAPAGRDEPVRFSGSECDF
jgi:hypothetical protein